MTKKQIRSKQRVADHGEVFTNEREVNAMLDLVKQESERIESRFLEPACGNGNFLAEILSRKLTIVKKQYGKSPLEYEKYSILAISSIYGVDILEDNAKECRKRLFKIWDKEYTKVCKNDIKESVRDAARFIIKCNVLYGDALTMLRNDGEPIVFAQWDFAVGNKIKRRDFRLDQMMKINSSKNSNEEPWVPSPIEEYTPINYWEVQDVFEY